jgi:hypothetical protein
VPRSLTATQQRTTDADRQQPPCERPEHEGDSPASLVGGLPGLVNSRASTGADRAVGAEIAACAFAHQQPSASAAADYRFAQPNVAELTIVLATTR